ncbi:MAG: hypothetical protein ACLR8Y_15645 [Alistipes indistinctus]
MTEDSSGTKDKEVVIEKFDTDKPTDPATGTPPLKERTTIRERQQTQQQTQATTKTGTHVHESDSIADRSKYNIELQGQVSDIVKTKRAVPWWVSGYRWGSGFYSGLFLLPKMENIVYITPEKIMPILTVL